jgi:hypothetical protein
MFLVSLTYAVPISDRYTNEEILIADSVICGCTIHSVSFAQYPCLDQEAEFSTFAEVSHLRYYHFVRAKWQ